MITITSAVKQSDGSWIFSWEETTSPYEIWLDGVLLDTVDDEEYIYTGIHYSNKPPPIEIVDSTEIADSEQYSPILRIQWYGSTILSGYIIEELVGSVWTQRASIKENHLGYYTYNTRRFTDGTTSSWRIRAFDSNRNTSTDTITFSLEVICNPDPPEISVSLSEGILTIDEE